MKIDVTRKLPEHLDTLILIHEENGKLKGLEFLDQDTIQMLENFVKEDDYSFGYGKISTFACIKGKKRETFILVGAGAKSKLDSNKMRDLFAMGWRAAMAAKAKQVQVMLGFSSALGDVNLGHVLAESALLSAYRFDKYLSKPEASTIENIHLLLSTKNTRYLNRGILEGRIFAESTNMARDLVNEPANIINPESLAEFAKKTALQYGFSIETHSADKIKRLKMDALLAVGKGSKVDPRLIIMRYTGNPDKKNQLIALVGKGLTYDTGGYCIKPANSMMGMKSDMGGAAAVIGTMAAVANLKLKVNVVAIIAAAENMISGEAYRPGDIITSMSGKTIEVVNTDAEGRLTLVDAIHYVLEKEKADKVLDIATLTGAAAAALGQDYSVVIGNNEPWIEQLKEASRDSGELIWQMPLHEPYKELIKSEMADMKNVGGPLAGAITAALFIREYVQNKPWIHIDIAGSTMKDKPKGIYGVGATGVGVRLLTSLLRNME
ncbi:MAG: leucyl aminopeptidase [Candidatus Cloacimonadaceae bacterium]